VLLFFVLISREKSFGEDDLEIVWRIEGLVLFAFGAFFEELFS